MKRKIIISILGISTLLISGCSSTKTTEINVLATTDLHSFIPYELGEYAKNELKKEENVALVDAGDFMGRDDSGAVDKYISLKNNDDKNNKKVYREMPLAKDMKEIGYDAVVLGNHEFESRDKFDLDGIVSDFNKQGIDVLSANTYNKDGSNYVKPYIIKKVKTPEGEVNLGILGLTIKEVGEKWHWDENGNKVESKSLELKDQPGFENLYMNDLVEDAKTYVKDMKKDGADVIVAVAHTGEKPKKPRNPGNRIQDLATQVEGIDAIVAGHNHEQIKQHDYTNKAGEKVIVTEPGDHGDCISKINFKLERDKDNWKVVEKSSDLKQIEQPPLGKNGGQFFEAIFKIHENDKEINLGKIIPFKWDKAYYFKTPISKEEIYDKVGYKYKSLPDVVDENIAQLVFMQGKKVVCNVSVDKNLFKFDLKFDQSDYEGNIVTIYPNKNDKFKVQMEMNKEYQSIYLTHTK
ncbi:metallophosphoesterase [Romboutsia lituseburensis]|uniref:Calcineurin-like phosphoesterase n=1 Tax=Romboutsia lituseburensis DSM 797 TaxID=1121325 RepID=A0A1G9IKR4_9FIRM|nr:metallophosphoesterase [Romboutsia lituseburensis]CEH33857.1 Ser/Thr phosphatase protein [Romboutsia lituseburensis]SDL25666.1 Calcineurin-like phosphoesterase [Romboutsia lituseburensis DSM 797]